MRRSTPALLLAPLLLLLLLVFVLPQLGMLGVALEMPAWSTAQFAHFLGDAHYWGVLLQSLLLGLEGVMYFRSVCA